MDELHRRSSQLDREHAGRMSDLLREVDLEVAQHFPTALSPALHRAVVAVFDHFSTVGERLIKALFAPRIEHRGVTAHFFSSIAGFVQK